MQRSLALLGNACGIAGPVLWAALIAYCASQVPDYSHVTRFISDLASRGSPTEHLMRYVGFVLTGGLYLGFALFLAWTFRRDWLALGGAALLAVGAAARIAAGLHPCDPGCDPVQPSADQQVHELAANVGYLAQFVAALLWGVALQRYARLKALGTFAIGCGTWAVVALVLLVVYPQVQGLLQRAAWGLLSLWVLLLAVGLWRTDAAAAPPVRESEQPMETSRP